ncbi:hypothetical protein ABOONEI_2061 [Aciduliprofundum boonei T469]|nr:hypothetical protein ABOONEI_2061 [Aciduliprofundum boonei T469]
MVDDIMDDEKPIPSEPTYTPAPKRKRSIFERLAYSPTAIGIVLVVALVLMTLGVFFYDSLIPSIVSGESDYFLTTVVVFLGMLPYSIGVSLLVLLLLGLGIGRHDYPQWVRFALILVAGMIIVWGFHLSGALIGAMIHYSSP